MHLSHWENTLLYSILSWSKLIGTGMRGIDVSYYPSETGIVYECMCIFTWIISSKYKLSILILFLYGYHLFIQSNQLPYITVKISRKIYRTCCGQWRNENKTLSWLTKDLHLKQWKRSRSTLCKWQACMCSIKHCFLSKLARGQAAPDFSWR